GVAEEVGVVGVGQEQVAGGVDGDAAEIAGADVGKDGRGAAAGELVNGALSGIVGGDGVDGGTGEGDAAGVGDVADGRDRTGADDAAVHRVGARRPAVLAEEQRVVVPEREVAPRLVRGRGE